VDVQKKDRPVRRNAEYPFDDPPKDAWAQEITITELRKLLGLPMDAQIYSVEVVERLPLYKSQQLSSMNRRPVRHQRHSIHRPTKLKIVFVSESYSEEAAGGEDGQEG
jgi:hypothetical protein